MSRALPDPAVLALRGTSWLNGFLPSSGKRRAQIIDSLAGTTLGQTLLLSKDVVRYDGDGKLVWFRTPSGQAVSTLMFYLHGGAYIMGSAATHANILSKLARMDGCAVAAFEYTLVHNQPLETMVDQCVRAYQRFAASFPHHTVVLAGDSAGGALALNVAMAVAHTAPPTALLLLSPWVNVDADLNFRKANDFLTRNMVGRVKASLCPNTQCPSAASPSNAPDSQLEGLPPTLVVYGTGEVLRPQIAEFVQKLRRLGVSVSVEVGTDMPHVFPIVEPWSARTKAAYSHIQRWLESLRSQR